MLHCCCHRNCYCKNTRVCDHTKVLKPDEDPKYHKTQNLAGKHDTFPKLRETEKARKQIKPFRKLNLHGHGYLLNYYSVEFPPFPQATNLRPLTTAVVVWSAARTIRNAR